MPALPTFRPKDIKGVWKQNKDANPSPQSGAVPALYCAEVKVQHLLEVFVDTPGPLKHTYGLRSSSADVHNRSRQPSSAYRCFKRWRLTCRTQARTVSTLSTQVPDIYGELSVGAWCDWNHQKSNRLRRTISGKESVLYCLHQTWMPGSPWQPHTLFSPFSIAAWYTAHTSCTFKMCYSFILP